MVQFDEWCSTTDSDIGAHNLRILTSNPARLAVGIRATAAIVPDHYAAEEQIASVLTRLGKPAAAELIRMKLPTTKAIRSGDLCEILTTEWITSQTGYQVPIKRLRWKDHRNMAMRGDDVIGLAQEPPSNRLRFLKAEAKSRATLRSAVVTEARSALDKDGGLPSAHALSFISARLRESGNTDLADAIDDAQLKHGILAQSVRHLLFTLSGNAPETFLATSLRTYIGPIAQWCVGLHVDGHGAFINAVYDLVIANANND